VRIAGGVAICGVAVVLLNVVPGCISHAPAAFAKPLAYAHESASYTLVNERNDLIARVNVTLEWREGVVAATTVVSKLKGPRTEASGTIVYSTRTGEALRVTEGNRTTFPWGVDRYLPSPTSALLFDYGGSLVRESVPFGPQMAVLVAGGSPTTKLDWGEIALTLHQTPANWSLEGTGNCQYQCGFVNVQPPVTLQVNMMGTGEGVLPVHASYSVPGVPLEFSLNRTEHAVGGPIVTGLQVAAPQPQSIPNGAPVCGLMPCEGDSWPSRLSLRRGMDALLASPQWQQWAQGKGPIVPLVLSVSSNLTTTTLGVSYAPQTFWVLDFAAGDREGDFVLKSVSPTPLTETPPVVTSSDDHAFTPDTFSNRTWGAPVLSMAEAIPSILLEANLSLDQAYAVTFEARPQGYFPDARGNLSWFIALGNYQAPDAWVLGSAKTGEAQEMVLAR
jgi:hypothetical protein